MSETTATNQVFTVVVNDTVNQITISNENDNDPCCSKVVIDENNIDTVEVIHYGPQSGFLNGIQVNNSTINNITNINFSGSGVSSSISGSVLTLTIPGTQTGSFATTGSNIFNGSQVVSGSITLNSGSLIGTASWAVSASRSVSASWADSASWAISSSRSISASYASLSNIQYVSNSLLPLSQLEIVDNANVLLSYTNGRLRINVGGNLNSNPELSFNNTFITDRFNNVLSTYGVTASFNLGQTTLISASLYEDNNLLVTTGYGDSVILSRTTSGSHIYKLYVTSSNALNQTVYSSTFLSGTLAKTNPETPSLITTFSIQLGSSSYQIEQGATGSVILSTTTGSDNGWIYISNSLSLYPVSNILYITGSLTGSSPIILSSSANYSSSFYNNPELFYSATSSVTYQKIKSVRMGYQPNSIPTSSFILNVSSSGLILSSASFNQLQNISAWDTSLGGNTGSIFKGIVSPSQIYINIPRYPNGTTGYLTASHYHYIVYDNKYPWLFNIGGLGSNVSINNFYSASIINPLDPNDGYKVYRTISALSVASAYTYLLIYSSSTP